MRELAKGERKELSEKAKFRLKVFDWYYRKSALHSLSGLADAPLACRHFGIQRSYFYRLWKTKQPAKYAQSRLPAGPAGKVRQIRKDDPTHSAKKIRPILMRAESAAPSVSTIGRLISRENLFFKADTKRRKKRSKSAQKAHERQRKPYNLKADAPRQIIEFDMKRVYLLGEKHCAFCAVDPSAKEAAIHAASSPSSRSAKPALEKAAARFGKNIKAANGNGGGNMKDAENYPACLNMPQYWTRPKPPKEKPFVERLIGTLQRECLDYNYAPLNVSELPSVVGAWLDKYHFYSPHQFLGFLSPAEFSAALGYPLSMRSVSYRY
jgi:hypothetical protein